MNIVSNESIKRQKIENASCASSNFLLRWRVLEFASAYLTFLDLIVVESLSKNHYRKSLEGWKIISLKYIRNIEWFDAENTDRKEKNNFVITFLFIKLLTVQSNQTEIVRKFGVNLSKLEKYPNIYAFGKLIIGKLRITPFICNQELLNSLAKISENAFQGCAKKKWGGDIWLHGCVQFNNPLNKKDDSILKKVAEQYWICATNMDAIISFINYSIELAVAMAQKKSFHGLIHFLNKQTNLSLEQLNNWIVKYGPLPPFLVQKANLLPQDDNHPIEVEKLLTEAFKGYGGMASKDFLETYFMIRICNKKYHEAQEIAEKYLGDKEDMILKILTSKFDEAEKLLTKIGGANYNYIQISIIIILQLGLNNYDFADFLLKHKNNKDTIRELKELNKMIFCIIHFSGDMFPEKMIQFLVRNLDSDNLFEIGKILKDKELLKRAFRYINNHMHFAYLIFTEWMKKNKSINSEKMNEAKSFINIYEKNKSNEKL